MREMTRIESVIWVAMIILLISLINGSANMLFQRDFLNTILTVLVAGLMVEVWIIRKK